MFKTSKSLLNAGSSPSISLSSLQVQLYWERERADLQCSNYSMRFSLHICSESVTSKETSYSGWWWRWAWRNFCSEVLWSTERRQSQPQSRAIIQNDPHQDKISYHTECFLWLFSCFCILLLFALSLGLYLKIVLKSLPTILFAAYLKHLCLTPHLIFLSQTNVIHSEDIFLG